MVTVHKTTTGVLHIDSVVVGDEYRPAVHVTWGLPFPKLIHLFHLNTAKQAFLIKVTEKKKTNKLWYKGGQHTVF